MPEGRYFWLRCHLNSLCLDLADGKAEPGNEVITWDYREAPNQLWYEDLVNHVIRSKADENLVLEEDDGKVIINSFHPGKDEQEWIVEADRVCRKNHSHRVLQIIDGAETHGARLCVEDFDHKPEHMWEAVHMDSPYFIIHSMLNEKKALDIAGADSSAGANVITWDHHGNENQQWFEDKHGFIRSRLNGYTFNTRDGHLEMDDIEVGHSGATWVRVGQAIINRFDRDQCLELKDPDEHSSKLVPGHYTGNPHQHWHFNFLE